LKIQVKIDQPEVPAPVQAAQNLWRAFIWQIFTNYWALSEKEWLQNKIPAQHWEPFWPYAQKPLYTRQGRVDTHFRCGHSSQPCNGPSWAF
jgi:hypothetical protein